MIFILTCSQSLLSHHPQAHPLLRGSITTIMMIRMIRMIMMIMMVMVVMMVMMVMMIMRMITIIMVINPLIMMMKIDDGFSLNALMRRVIGDKPGKARGSLRVFSVEFPKESGSENRSGSETPKLKIPK